MNDIQALVERFSVYGQRADTAAFLHYGESFET
jgi:hypothetical protein